MHRKGDDLARTLDEHQSCLRALAEVEDCLDRDPARQRANLARLVNRLRTLNATLRPHFAGEEGGLFSRLRMDYPRLASRFETLERQHEQTLESLQAALQNAEQLSSDSEVQQFSELDSRVRSLADALRRHESEENELVMDADWTTVGISD